MGIFSYQSSEFELANVKLIPGADCVFILVQNRVILNIGSVSQFNGKQIDCHELLAFSGNCNKVSERCRAELILVDPQTSNPEALARAESKFSWINLGLAAANGAIKMAIDGDEIIYF